MMEALNVDVADSTQAIEMVQDNLAWKSSEAAEVIQQWFNKDLNTPPNESTTADVTATTSVSTESSPTESSTLAGSKTILSTVLGISCAVLRLLL